jgi:mono/diheme cytochrome c family protein
MSLRSLPSAERSFATLVVLALALALGLGLSSVFTRELRPIAPNQLVPARSRLMAVLEGVMAENVQPAETARFRAWVEAGATREGFDQVKGIVTGNCAGCHGQDGQLPRITGFEDLRPLALEATPEGLADLVDARTLHLIGVPLIYLVAAGAYLRRTAFRWRKGLMVTCALTVAFDAAQWWLRQAHPRHLWAAWLSLGCLGAGMLTLVGVVLMDLWGPKPD